MLTKMMFATTVPIVDGQLDAITLAASKAISRRITSNIPHAKDLMLRISC